MTQGWLKVYYRDEKGVMRAIEGVKLLPGNTIRLAKSVYTLDSRWVSLSDHWFEIGDDE